MIYIFFKFLSKIIRANYLKNKLVKIKNRFRSSFSLSHHIFSFINYVNVMRRNLYRTKRTSVSPRKKNRPKLKLVFTCISSFFANRSTSYAVFPWFFFFFNIKSSRIYGAVILREPVEWIVKNVIFFSFCFHFNKNEKYTIRCVYGGKVVISYMRKFLKYNRSFNLLLVFFLFCFLTGFCSGRFHVNRGESFFFL